MATEVFHAARRSARQSISKTGLLALEPHSVMARKMGNPKAVYAFRNVDMCQWHVSWYPEEKFDVWAIDTTGLPIQIDSTHEALGGVAILTDVSVDRIRFSHEIDRT